MDLSFSKVKGWGKGEGGRIKLSSDETFCYATMEPPCKERQLTRAHLHFAFKTPFSISQMYISSLLQQHIILSSGLKQHCRVHPLCPLSFLARFPVSGLHNATLRSCPVEASSLMGKRVK